MSVYVDKAQNSFGRMVMCHMLADDVEELHQMADKIGVKRKWFQGSRMPHYDICKSKRMLAIEHGAIEIDSKKVTELVRRWRDTIFRRKT